MKKIRHLGTIYSYFSLFLFPQITPAATLEIQFTGFDFVYDASVQGGAIYDVMDVAGGTGNPNQSDVLDTINFKVDGVLEHTLSTDIYADLLINGIGDIPIGGTVTVYNSYGYGGYPGYGYGGYPGYGWGGYPGYGWGGYPGYDGTNGTIFFDILTGNNTPGWGLALDGTEVTISHINGSTVEIAISAAGASEIIEQILPFGYVLNEYDLVTFSFISTSFTTVNDGVNLTSFAASGNGNVTGTLVPLPAALYLFASGIFALIGIARRKRIV